MKIEDVVNNSEILFSYNEIKKTISNIANKLNEQFKDLESEVVLLPIMKGAIPFAGHLIPKLTFDTNIEYIHLTRYKHNLPTEDFNWIYKPPISDISGKHVVVLDDILDEGITLLNVTDQLKLMGANSITTAVLFDKKINFNKVIIANYVGLEVPNHYVYGFGLDFKGAGRNLPNLYAFNEK
tara:strand:- start:436 stop:981 length:546 start_codon:yes stop_codon:yes gene_type:complete